MFAEAIRSNWNGGEVGSVPAPPLATTTSHTSPSARPAGLATLVEVVVAFPPTPEER